MCKTRKKYQLIVMEIKIDAFHLFTPEMCDLCIFLLYAFF